MQENQKNQQRNQPKEQHLFAPVKRKKSMTRRWSVSS